MVSSLIFVFFCWIPQNGSAELPVGEKLTALMDEYQEYDTQTNPLEATARGINNQNDKLPSQSFEQFARNLVFYKQLAEKLDALDRNALSREARIDFDITRYKLQENIDRIHFNRFLMPLKADDGFHISFAFMPNEIPQTTVQDYENYLSRLRAWPRYVEENIALLKKGMETGFIIPKVVLEGYEVTIDSHVVEDPTKSVFYQPFARIPETMPQADRSRLEAEGRKVIMENVVTGYRDFLEFMTKTYIPNARETIGTYALPNGRKNYAALIREFTTLDMTPQQVHALGLEEVARIRAEMQQVIGQVGFKGDFPAFLEFLRTDQRFYARTPEELLTRASFLAKSMDAQLPQLFKKLPRQPYGVAPVPDHLAPKYTGGRYIGAPLDSKMPGYYWVNTYDLPSRPLYVLEALTLHEAVPGHHLQGALASEMDTHPIRQGFYISAFGEGWGLYSEWLGLEAGFYTDPYSNFGRLTYEMWRACRLVVDTGIHEYGWSRDRVLAYLGENTALSRHEITTETDRYIAWPGQAVSYKIGELKIKELRKRAENKLGSKFDVRDFHDVVLRNGAVLLKTLEQEVDLYIQETRGSGE